MGPEEGGQTNDTKPKVRVIAPIQGVERKVRMAPLHTAPISRTCAFHRNMPAVYICAQCSKPLCMSCAVPYGHLFICPQCYQPPPPPVMTTTTQEAGEGPLPTMESILGLFGALLLIIGFFMPWATPEYSFIRYEETNDFIVSGFTIAGDYPETTLVLTIGVLIIIIEFLLLILATSPTMAKAPPIGIRLLPMFLGFVALVILLEVVLRAENLLGNLNVGWFVCLIGAVITLLRGVVAIFKHYTDVEA
jgi:hypothetical protein